MNYCHCEESLRLPRSLRSLAMTHETNSITMNILAIPIQLGAVAFLIFAFTRVWLRMREG